MRAATTALEISDGQREAPARSRTAPHRQVQQAKALLLAAEGVANTRSGRQVGVSAASVQAWRARFVADGVAKIGKVRSGRGREPAIPQAKIDEIVDLTRNSTPEGETHWSCRSMAKKVGVSKDTLQRVWAVVGLYLGPPDNAIVLCMDEKSSVQAFDRTQPSMPMAKGRAQTMTHDYKRHGTTTLFAALDVLTDKVIGSCLPEHRHQEFLKFLRTIDREVPKGLDIHMILDNYATHVCPESDVMRM
jgi:hypothetical protein